MGEAAITVSIETCIRWFRILRLQKCWAEKIGGVFSMSKRSRRLRRSLPWVSDWLSAVVTRELMPVGELWGFLPRVRHGSCLFVEKSLSQQVCQNFAPPGVRAEKYRKAIGNRRFRPFHANDAAAESASLPASRPVVWSRLVTLANPMLQTGWLGTLAASALVTPGSGDKIDRPSSRTDGSWFRSAVDAGY